MNLRRASDPERRSEISTRSGMALLEAVVYIGLFLLVAGMAFALFYRTEEQSRGLRRSADDITAALNAGERWRDDVRATIAPPQVEERAIRLPQQGGVVRYYFKDGALWRESGMHSARVLPQVQDAIFEQDARGQVTAWRCTVELRKRRHQGSLTPLFTFTAVPTSTIKR